MENNIYAINDVSVGGFNETSTAKFILMNVRYQIGMTEMNVPYSLMDENKIPIWNQAVSINQAELDAWGTDDNYMIDLVCQKVGVVRK
jgi:hypothetical protein